MLGFDPSSPQPPVAPPPKPKGASKPAVLPDFTPPVGMDLTGKNVGDSWEVIAKVSLCKGGKLCLESLNGIPMPDGDNDADDGNPGGTDSDGDEDSQAGPPGETFTAAIARRSKGMK